MGVESGNSEGDAPHRGKTLYRTIDETKHAGNITDYNNQRGFFRGGRFGSVQDVDVHYWGAKLVQCVFGIHGQVFETR
tara:strand:- start:36 stop:269 length:234 start_codon:yes stop_codon:yes gene_type:complete